MEKVIEVSGLQKSYGKVQAVKGLDFYVEKGKLFAFLGPNGAGKSTTIDILCTFLRPDAGEVCINGHLLGREDDAIRSSIGAVFQDGLLDDLLTVKENLMARASLYGLGKKRLKEAVRQACEAAGVTEFSNRPYGKLSGGQRRRADIARALLHTPKILFLDEPTTGLDPQTRSNVWQTIQNLKHETDMAVFLTTHYMEEAAAADYVIVIDDGKIAAKGTPAELKERYASDLLRMRTDQIEAMEQVLAGLGFSYERSADTFALKLAHTVDALPILEQCKALLTGIEITTGTMDDAFLGITGKGIRE